MSKDRLKILIVMDPGILVPPKGYGGHERLVYLFAREYCKMGHEVHLLVTTGSEVEGCTVHNFGEEGFPQNPGQVRAAIWNAWKFLWKHRSDFDLIHNFGRLLYLLPVLNYPVKKIMTYGREINASNVNKSVALPHKNLVFTGCSNNLIQRTPLKGRWEAVYNAIDFSKYQLQADFDENAPLIFLGRIEKVKGCHIAIQVARQTNSKLIIAGNISPLADEQEYFRKQIEPFIDGKQVEHVGQVNDEQKNFFLQQAKGLLFPIEWDEPFGIVMIEAMACGTPVIAFKRGSVDEVVKEGVSGFKVNTAAQMADAVGKLSFIDRGQCREYAVKNFNALSIARRYLSFFDAKGGNKKIVIVTTGQPAANPRVVKEYETLKNNGYDTKVLYTYSAEWSHGIDEDKFAKNIYNKNDFILVGGNPHTGKWLYLATRVAHKFFRFIIRYTASGFAKDMSLVRSSFVLWKAAARHKADFYIAHYVGALSAVANAAKKYKTPFAFDAEDYHRGEPVYYDNQKEHIVEVENRYLPNAAFISAASPLIAEAYKKHYPAVKVITLNNVFSKRFLQAAHTGNNGALTLFWFSQNIGPNRGLEIIIEAMNKIEDDISLYLLGNNKNQQYLDSLIAKAGKPQNIHLIPPVVPEEVFSIAARYDVGLASELPLSQNRELCLTNKIFTYLLAGNCVLASDTKAQKGFMEANPGLGLVYNATDAAHLAMQIKKLINDRPLLNEYKRNALAASSNKLNWEEEEGKLKLVTNSILENQ